MPRTCTHCDYESQADGDAYCGGCGQELTGPVTAGKPPATKWQTPSASEWVRFVIWVVFVFGGAIALTLFMRDKGPEQVRPIPQRVAPTGR